MDKEEVPDLTPFHEVSKKISPADKVRGYAFFDAVEGRHPPALAHFGTKINLGLYINEALTFDHSAHMIAIRDWSGNLLHQPSGGLNDSPCLFSKSDYSWLAMPLEVERLPARIAFWTRLPKTEVGSLNDPPVWSAQFTTSHCVATFNNLDETKKEDLKDRWVPCEILVNGRFAELRVDNKLKGVMYHEPEPHALLRLVFQGRHYIDNLKIELLRNSDLQHFETYQKILDAIPPAQRKGIVPIPYLRGVKPQYPVSLRFYDLPTAKNTSQGTPPLALDEDF